jgi:hypothetical protein
MNYSRSQIGTNTRREGEAVIIHREPDATRQVCRDGIARRVKDTDIRYMGCWNTIVGGFYE